MNADQEIFHAKILLFGEYTIILHSKALSIPYTYFTGHLSFIDHKKYTRFDKAVRSNEHLQSYHKFLSTNDELNNLIELDLDQFRKDIDEGLYFESNIPQGYGIGSSGALVAALYSRYSSSPLEASDNSAIQELKEIFSILESYFHGTSSGMDPLNCYISEPLLVHNDHYIEKVSVPHKNNNRDGAVFLLNSGYPGNTEPLVTGFLEKTKDSEYRQKLLNEIIPLNNTCINFLVKGDLESFFLSLKELSLWQLKYFTEMIPGKFNTIWKEGLDRNDYYLKLCGSGGGGFFLGFTGNYDHAEDIMKKKGFDIMPVFKNFHFKGE